MSRKSDRGTRRPKEEKPEETKVEQPVPRYPVGEPEQKECGCVEQLMNDDTRDINPCIPHAIVQAANCMVKVSEAMGQAAQSLGFAGMQLVNQEQLARDSMAAQDQIDKAGVDTDDDNLTSP